MVLSYAYEVATNVYSVKQNGSTVNKNDKVIMLADFATISHPSGTELKLMLAEKAVTIPHIISTSLCAPINNLIASDFLKKKDLGHRSCSDVELRCLNESRGESYGSVLMWY